MLSLDRTIDAPLLERYELVEASSLTNLGVLLVDARRERARIGGVGGNSALSRVRP